MQLTKYPQSCFLIETEGKKILIDPGNFFFDFVNADNFKDVDIILITHKHGDHCFPEGIKKISDNTIILTNPEVKEILKKENIKSEIIQVDEEKTFDNIKIKAVKAVHGYWVEMKTGLPKDNNGFLITDTKTSVYHCSDTICFENHTKADIVLVPICGHSVVMEPDVAIAFCEVINPKLVIPMHYESKKHALGTEKFEKLVKSSSLKYKVLKNGEEVEV